ncbi:MAG: 50S ribosomal protein L30 [Clostridia bacterium]|nr:50S ribosomal protein L30 [Clostridia bacterium]NCC75425.1 50S ribosomal protein L30 [Clostridia bacterium]
MSKVKITLTKSTNNATHKHKATIQALGLRKIGQTVELEFNPALQGMLRLVAYLVKVEEA